MNDAGPDTGSPNDDGGNPMDSGHAGDSGQAGDSGHVGDSGTVTPGLHVVQGTGGAPGHIVDGAGNVVQLHGVDRSGTEYSCLNGAFFDGPTDQTAVDAVANAGELPVLPTDSAE